MLNYMLKVKIEYFVKLALAIILKEIPHMTLIGEPFR